MAKVSALDKAIASIEEKKAALLTKANNEATALEAAILAMKAQLATKRSKGPKAVVAEKVGA